MKYFDLVKEVIEKRWRFIEIKYESRKIDIFKNESKWIRVEGLRVDDVRDIHRNFNHFSLPFFAVKVDEVYYFLDFNEFYREFILDGVTQKNDSDLVEKYKDFLLLANYSFVGPFRYTFNSFVKRSFDDLKWMYEKFGLDYVIWMSEISKDEYCGNTEIRFMIKDMKKLDFNKWFVFHVIKEEDEDLSISFCVRLMKILERLLKYEKFGFELKGLVYDKDLFLDMFEEKVFKKFLKKVFRIDYETRTDLTIDERIEKMEDVVKDIEFKKTYSGGS
ncbi:MAG: hypothetical protein NC926_08550 [Candidatus Omnitrophica bacterium]|nr:hypothetical protein [Candidatus Omnitrophota bacterium]